MHKTVKGYKKQNKELQRQVDDLQLLVGERDAEVRDLACKDLLPDQILRAQHALQALQDHLTEQHMRQLLGTEPLQAILGAVSKKEENNQPHYIQMIDSMDPVAALKQEGQENDEGDTVEGVPIQHKARERLAAIQQRKQQSRQQQRRQVTEDNNDDNGRIEDNPSKRRVETPRRQEEDTTAVTETAIVERQRGVLQVRKKRRRRLVVATTTTVLACLSTVTTSLSHLVFTTLPFVAQQLQLASNYVSWRQVERLQLAYNYSCQVGDYYRSYYRTTSKVYQHLHLHENPLQALNYVISMVNNSMSTTIVPVNE